MSSIALRSHSRSHLRLRKPAGWVLGAAISMAAITAIAVEDQAGAVPTQAECNAFKAATESAMKNQLMIVNTFMGSATKTMQSAVSKGNSCIGNLAMLDFDMSRLIPDFGLLGSLLSGAVGRIVDGVINRACAALTDVMNKPSEIWNSIVGGINVNDQFQNWAGGINYGLPGGSGSSGGGNWGAAQPGTVDPWKTPTSQTPTSPDGLCTYGPKGMQCNVAGVDAPPQTVSGADIGANYQYLVIACTGALQAQAEGGGGAGQGSPAACAQAQDYLNAYAPYLDASAIPKIPGYQFSIPSNIGSGLGAGSGGTGSSSGTTTGSGSGRDDFWRSLIDGFNNSNSGSTSSPTPTPGGSGSGFDGFSANPSPTPAPSSGGAVFGGTSKSAERKSAPYGLPVRK